MRQRNNYFPPRDSRLRRIVRHLREWRARHGRTVRDQMIRGAAYGVGSGAVSLLVLWVQTRH